MNHGPGTGTLTASQGHDELASVTDRSPPLPDPLPRCGGEGTKPKRPDIARRLFLAVFVAGLTVRIVRLLMNSALWGDEAMVVRSFLDRTYGELFAPLDYVQLAPLGFLWAELTSFHWFGNSEWVWRLVPALAGCASLIWFARFALQVLPRHAAWLATAIMAASIYLIRHSVEAKPYILDFAAALVLAQLGWRIHQHPNRVGRWIAFGAAAVICVWCSFPSAFAAGGILLSLIPVVAARFLRAGNQDVPHAGNVRHVKPSPMIPIAWLSCGVALSASFVAMYLLFGRNQMQIAEEVGYWKMSMWEVAYPPWHRPDLFLFWLIREHAGTMMAHPFGGKNFASTGTLLLVLGGVVTMHRRNPRLTWMLLAPAAVGLFAACLRKYPYGGTARTMLYLAPAICLFAGLGGWALIVRFFSAQNRRAMAALALASCLGLILVKLVLEIAFPYKQHEDWVVRDTVRRWAAEAEPDELWIIANAAATPDRQDRGIQGGVTVAVFDHYALQTMGGRAIHSRRVLDYPQSSGLVMVLVHETVEDPRTVQIGETYRDRYLAAANLIREDVVTLSSRETLRRLVFTPQP